MSKKNKKDIDEKEMSKNESCSCHEGDESECCGDCCCGEGSSEQPHFVRQFYTRAERITMMEEYLTDLKAEIAGVEEELADLRKQA